MASASASSSNQPREPQPKARAQTRDIKITAVGSWTKAWNLAEAEGDVTKFFHIAVKKFIFDADEASLYKRWRDHHGMKNTKWQDQLRKLELEQPLFHILVPTGKTKHWSRSTHKFTHANPWLQAMLHFSRALQKETSMNFLLGCLDLSGEPGLDFHCFFFKVGGRIWCLEVYGMARENDDPCMLAIVWPAFDDYADNGQNVWGWWTSHAGHCVACLHDHQMKYNRMSHVGHCVACLGCFWWTSWSLLI